MATKADIGTTGSEVLGRKWSRGECKVKGHGHGWKQLGEHEAWGYFHYTLGNNAVLFPYFPWHRSGIHVPYEERCWSSCLLIR